MNTLIRSILIVFAFFIAAPVARAQVNLDVTAGTRNKYVLSYSGLNVHDGPVIQSDFFWTLPKGVWADLYTSTDLGLRANFGREIDYGFGWTGKNLSLGTYYLDLNQLFSTGPVGDVVETYVKASAPYVSGAHTFTLSAEMNYFFSTAKAKNSSPLPITILQHDWSIWKGLALHHDGAITYSAGIFQTNRGFMGRYQASLTETPLKWLTIRAPYLRIHTPLSDAIKDRKTETIVGMDVIFHIPIVKAAKEGS